MEKHFTSTVFILDRKETKILLLYHKKLQKWLPPGGHMEPNETPPETARREVLEETGLEIEFLEEENILIDRWNATSLERPYLCLLENIPAYKEIPAHQHIDMVYIAESRSKSNILPINCQWFKIEDLEAFTPDIDIFEETLQITRHLVSNLGKFISKNRLNTQLTF